MQMHALADKQDSTLTVHSSEVLPTGGGRQRRHGVFIDAVDITAVVGE